MASGKVIFTFMDNTLEKSNAEFRGVELTAANFDAQVTLQNNLLAAIGGIANGVLTKTQRVASVSEASPAAPATTVQREQKYLARYHAEAGSSYRTEIPCIDLGVLVSGTEIVDLTAGVGLAFKTAFDAYVKGEDGVTAAVLDSLTYVTRNI